MKAVLSENNIPFEFVDITASMPNLKSFLDLRDTSDAFRELRGAGKVGIPVLVVDGTAYIAETPDEVRAVLEQLGK